MSEILFVACEKFFIKVDPSVIPDLFGTYFDIVVFIFLKPKN